MNGLLHSRATQDAAVGGGTLLLAAADAAAGWSNPATVMAILGSLLLVIRAATELVRVWRGKDAPNGQ
jgi:hypothetical protein